MDINKIRVGRELDGYVLAMVFNKSMSMVGIVDQLPKYSTDISASWEVVEKMQNTPCKDGDHYVARVEGMTGAFLATFFHHLAGSPADYGLEYFEARGATAPEAICRAALLAIQEGGQA